MERLTRFELATFDLGSRRSTTELQPHSSQLDNHRTGLGLQRPRCYYVCNRAENNGRNYEKLPLSGWCSQEDSNLHAEAAEPKPAVSAIPPCEHIKSRIAYLLRLVQSRRFTSGIHEPLTGIRLGRSNTPMGIERFELSLVRTGV